jgi:hypothetical protein
MNRALPAVVGVLQVLLPSLSVAGAPALSRAGGAASDQPVVYRHTAGKYHRLTCRLSKDQKVL